MKNKWEQTVLSMISLFIWKKDIIILTVPNTRKKLLSWTFVIHSYQKLCHLMDMLRCLYILLLGSSRKGMTLFPNPLT
jgi:hypothetical protein